MSKYAPLTAHLRDSGQMVVSMTFEEIEKVIGATLPSSAFNHRPWWSNNPSNSVITHSWLKARYKTAKVDMTGRKLEFHKVAPDGSAPDIEGQPPRGGAPEKTRTDLFWSIFGALKGMVTVAPGVDLTEPAAKQDERDAAR